MKALRLFTIALIITQCAMSYSQDAKPEEFIYSEECLPPEVKTHMNDTIYDLYLVFKHEDIENIKELVLIDDSSEKVYRSEELLSDNKQFKKRGDKIYVKIGKANINREIQITGVNEDRNLLKFKKAKSHASIN